MSGKNQNLSRREFLGRSAKAAYLAPVVLVLATGDSSGAPSGRQNAVVPAGLQQAAQKNAKVAAVVAEKYVSPPA